jgi:hypothetical protein
MTHRSHEKSCDRGERDTRSGLFAAGRCSLTLSPCSLQAHPSGEELRTLEFLTLDVFLSYCAPILATSDTTLLDEILDDRSNGR